MDITDLRAAVRAETGNDLDEQYTDTQLGVWFWVAYGKLRRRLTARFPELFTTTSSEVTLDDSTVNLEKPTNFAGLVRIERQYGTEWAAVAHASKVDPHLDCYLGFREEGGDFYLSGPPASIPGTYRIVYKTSPAACFPAEDVPRGFEDVLIQEVIAKAQIRIGGDPQPHYNEAEKTYKDQVRALLVTRHDNAPEPGLATGYGAGSDDLWT